MPAVIPPVVHLRPTPTAIALLRCANDFVYEKVQDEGDMHKMMPASPTCIKANFGRGKLVVFSSHPESSHDSLELIPLACRYLANNPNNTLAYRISHLSEAPADDIIYSKHGFHRFQSASRCIFEQFDDHRSSFTRSQISAIIKRIFPEMSNEDILALIDIYHLESGCGRLRTFFKNQMFSRF